MSVWIVFALGLLVGMYTGGMYVRMKYATRLMVLMKEYKAMIEKQKNNRELEKRVEEEVRRRLDRLVGDVVNETKPH